MALQYISTGDGKVAIGSDSATNERGYLMKLYNGTAGNTVKGQLVSLSDSADRTFILQTNEYDSIGVVQEAGIASESEAWVWTVGSLCQVLYKDGVAPTRGNVAIAADTDGRATDMAVPTGNPNVNDHFKEIGHVAETKSSGTDVLALVHLHFN